MVSSSKDLNDGSVLLETIKHLFISLVNDQKYSHPNKNNSGPLAKYTFSDYIRKINSFYSLYAFKKEVIMVKEKYLDSFDFEFQRIN